MAISPPLSAKGANAEVTQDLNRRYETSPALPKRIFTSVGRYEAKSRFTRPAQNLRQKLAGRRDLDLKFVEIGSGHSLVGFRSVLPEAFAWLFPGAAFG